MATVFVFNNVSGGDWNTSANWTPNGVPAAGDTAQISGGTFTVSTTQNETIAILETAKSVTLAIGSHTTFDVTSGTGPGANAGAITVANGATIELGGTFLNSGSIALNATTSNTALQVTDPTSAVTLTGGGKVVLAGGAIIGNGGVPASVTNLNNVIDGTGSFGIVGGALAFINKATVNADNASQMVFHLGSVTNSGTMEATSIGGLVFQVATTNAKTIEALGANTKVVIASTVTNTATGVILASGSGAHVDLQGGTIAGGTLQTSGAGAMIDVVSGANGTLDGSSAGHPLTNKGLFVVSAGATANIAGTIVNSSTISVGGNGSGGVLRVALGGASLQGTGKVILSDFGNGSIQMVTSGGSGGTLTNVGNTIMGAGTIGGSGTTLVNQAAAVINGNDFSALVLSGTVSNAGVLKSTQIAGGLVIAGTVVNSKTIEALGAGVGLTISGTVSNSKSGVVLASGVGAHVDLDGATVSGGMLQTMGVGAAMVISGATSATVELIGAYTSGNFTLGNDGNGHVLITDPPVVAQRPGNAAARIADGTVLEVDVADSGKVTFGGTNGTLLLDDASLFTGAVAGFRGLDRIDLAQIGFGTETTLGYSANAAGTGGTLRVSDGVHTASIALLGNYMAASFATAADGHGGTLITEADQAAHTPLASPRHA